MQLQSEEPKFGIIESQTSDISQAIIHSKRRKEGIMNIRFIKLFLLFNKWSICQ